MEDSYLIPANSKKSMLILGYFTPVDLFIFAMGIVFSLIMLVTVNTNKLYIMILIISPALISAFCCLPIPNYHNVLQLITNVYDFFTKRRRYYWKGWCVSSGDNEK